MHENKNQSSSYCSDVVDVGAQSCFVFNIWVSTYFWTYSSCYPSFSSSVCPEWHLLPLNPPLFSPSSLSPSQPSCSSFFSFSFYFSLSDSISLPYSSALSPVPHLSLSLSSSSLLLSFVLSISVKGGPLHNCIEAIEVLGAQRLYSNLCAIFQERGSAQNCTYHLSESV